jgi:hypothetical protein
VLIIWLAGVKILFTIMMTTSDDDVGLLRHVLSVIYSPDHYYVIHADYGNSFPDSSFLFLKPFFFSLFFSLCRFSVAIWNRPYNKFVEDMKKVWGTPAQTKGNDLCR